MKRKPDIFDIVIVTAIGGTFVYAAILVGEWLW